MTTNGTVRGWEWLVGTRYLRSAHRRGFVSFVAAISVLGLALGVAVLIVVLSVMNGFERELRSRMLSVTSHATLTGLEGSIADWRAARASALRQPGVMQAVPFVESQAMLARGRRVLGTAVRGVDPALEAEMLLCLVDGIGVHALISPRTLTAKRQLEIVDAYLARLARG